MPRDINKINKINKRNKFSIPDRRKAKKDDLLSGKENLFELLISQLVHFKKTRHMALWYMPLRAYISLVEILNYE